VLKNDGTLWACGSNAMGQLGLGDLSSRNRLTQVPLFDVAQVFTGDAASIIKLKDGTAWGCGNRYGQLGLGHDNTVVTFTRAPFLDDAVQIAITFNEVFALKPDGTVWGAGRNYTKLLAQGDNELRATFVKVPVSDVKQLSGCGSNIVVQKANGEVWGWGDNFNNELGLSDNTRRVTPVLLRTSLAGTTKIFAGTATTFLLDNNGKVWAAGANARGQLGMGDRTNRATFTQVAFFDTKTIDAIIPHTSGTSFKETNGTVWNVGDNLYGQMGLGGISTVGDTIPVKLNGFIASSLTGNGSTSYALKGDGTGWGWGSNSSGALGTGLDTAYVSSPIQLK
jgi:alpha-tubulin suppressor-like RCC1 family protein